MSEEKTSERPAENKNVEEILSEARRKLDDIVGKSSTGRLILAVPLRGDGEDVPELIYDFTALTGWEYMDALDKDTKAKPDAYHISKKQALSLFAVAAAKETAHVDAEDIMERLSPQDSIAAVQVATLFFNACTRAGEVRTMRT